MRQFLLLALLLACVWSAGCDCLPPLRTQSSINMALETPVRAKVEATINNLPDLGPLQEITVLGASSHAGKVAVIDVDGLLINSSAVGAYSLGENPVSLFQEKLNAAACDPAVRAVVLRINTPGGGVAAAEIMGRALADFRAQTGKPVVACLLDMAAGGGYYLAASCDHVMAMPSSVVGGIGVVMNLYYMELAMEQWNVFGASVKAGERIDMGTPTRKMTDEEKTMLTAMAKDYHENFRRVVLHGRPQLNPASKVLDGRVMSASTAVREGLVDCIGFLPDAVHKATELAGQKCDCAVMYRRGGSPARSLYETIPNRPMQAPSLANIPGLERSRLPLFLYMWDAEPTLVRINGA